jgi:hypothetical protein
MRRSHPPVRDKAWKIPSSSRHPRFRGGPLRGRPAVRWPADASLSTTTPSTQKPGEPYPHLAEQCGNPVRPPVFHMAPPAAGTAVRPQHRVVVGLRGDDLLLNLRQQLLPLGQCQTELGDIDKTIGPDELHDVDAQGLTVDPSSNQPQNSPHPRSPQPAIYPADRTAYVFIPPISGQSRMIAHIPVYPRGDQHGKPGSHAGWVEQAIKLQRGE